MTGVSTVFRHEWVGFFRRGIGWWLVFVVGAIGGITATVESRAWSSEAPARLTAQEREIEQWLGLGDTHIHEAGHRGYFLVRPAPPAAVLDRGVLDFGGSAIWLEAHRRNAPQLRATDSAGVIPRAIPRGLGPVLLWLAPLLMALLMYGVVADERADGSLAFAVSSGASPMALVVGKTLATIALVWTALVTPIALGVGLTASNGLAVGVAFGWAAIVMIAVAVFSCVLVSVSALAPSPTASLVTLLLFWFGATILAPRVVAGATKALVPIPSSQTVRSEAEVAVDQLDGAETRIRIAERLRGQGVDEPNPAAVSALALETDAAAVFAELFEPLETGMRRQSRLLELLSWLSPTTSADLASDRVLGVGDQAQFDFEARGEAARIATHMALNEGWARIRDSDRGSTELWSGVVDAAERYALAPASTGVSRIGLPGVGLLIWCGIGALALALATRSIGRIA